jgi:hypothetical protein
MTITEVLLNFRAALVAVLPMVEALGIPWKRGDAYDEWDELVSCMYEQLVANLVSALDASNGGAPARLAAYDMMLPDYRQYAIIEVESDELGPGRWVFHGFGTDKTPFDLIEARELTTDGSPCGEALRTCPLIGSRLSLRLPDGSSIARVPAYSDA